MESVYVPRKLEPQAVIRQTITLPNKEGTATTIPYGTLKSFAIVGQATRTEPQLLNLLRFLFIQANCFIHYLCCYRCKEHGHLNEVGTTLCYVTRYKALVNETYQYLYN